MAEPVLQMPQAQPHDDAMAAAATGAAPELAPAAGLLPGPDELDLNPHFAAFAMDAASQRACVRLADANGWPAGAVCTGNIDAIQPLVDAMHLPRLLVVDLDGATQIGTLLPLLAHRIAQGGAVLAIGSTNDCTLYRHLLSAGAADYLLKPLDPDTLIAAAEEVQRSGAVRVAGASGAAAEPQRGKVTLVSGVRGGVGASTVAVNLAWFLGHEQALKTCLLDLDLHFGTTSLALDLEPGFGLREALESPERMDALMLMSSMVNESDHLAVLGAEEPVENGFRFDPAAVAQLVEELAGSFGAVVVDVPRALLPTQPDLLNLAEEIVLVTDLSLAGIRDCGRVKGAVDSAGSPATVRILASRVGKDRPAQIDRATFERSLDGKLAGVVPEDGKTLAACANAGKAIGAVAPKTPIAGVLRDLAHELGGQAEAAKPAGLFGKLRRVAASL